MMRSNLSHSACISVYFVDAAEPILIKVVYRGGGDCDEILSVRGKTGGAFDTQRTFQWTAAVQGLCILLLMRAVGGNSQEEVTLSGGQGSVAASLDYALDKQPAWLADMFGITADGTTTARKLLRRTNPGRKSKGPVVIGFNKSFLASLEINVFWNDVQLKTPSMIAELLSLLRNKIGIGPFPSSPEAEQEKVFLQSEPSDCTENSLFKTPFILRHTQEGCAFTRLYQHGGSTFFVASFGQPHDLSESTMTPVRLQFDCPASSAFEWTDCDCSAQLEESLHILRSESGVLIYLVPENSTATLFSSYLTSTEAGRGFFSSPHAFAATDEYRRNLSASYDAASAILRDLAIKECALLTNSASKVVELQERGVSVTKRSLPTQATPQNLGFLYGQYGRELTPYLKRDESLSFCVARRWQDAPVRTWIIGGEDTLWEDNIYYEDFIRKFIDHVAGYLGDQSRAKIRAVLDSCSVTNTRDNGYGPLVFEQTLKMTWAHLRHFYGDHFKVPYPIHLMDRVADTLLQIPIRVQADGEELLWRIKQAGERVVLFTQGPVDIQLHKTAQLHVAPFFDAIAYVSHKTEETFNRLLKLLNLSPTAVVVIGNNLSTEVQPAVNLGITAIHYDNPNGWASLSRATVPRQGYRKVRTLRDLYSEFEKPKQNEIKVKRAKGGL
jgi:putative hydrolase of the HAD superfamily